MVNAVFSPLLIPLSWMYRWGLEMDRAFKSRAQVQLKKPVISIGNITLGGSGKTPLLMKLARELITLHLKPAILTRGYRGWGRTISPVVLKGGNPSGAQVSDEVSLMMRTCPSVPLGVGPNRVRSAENILKTESVDVFLLDDGFQHWSVNRRMDMVCVDATNPWGGNRLIPWGRLREPVSSLKRAQVVVLTRTELATPRQIADLTNQISLLSPGIRIVPSYFNTSFHAWRSKEIIPKEKFMGQKIIAVSGIGSPWAFEEYLRRLGADVFPHRFMDHHLYSWKDVNLITKRAQHKRAFIVTTEKDAVKLQKLPTASHQRDIDSFIVAKVSLELNENEASKWENILNEIQKFSISR